MNRIIEIVAMSIGGLSLFLVCFVGFVSLSGRDASQVAVIGKLFPASKEPDEQAERVAGAVEPENQESLSDAAVIESRRGVLSAWSLPWSLWLRTSGCSPIARAS